MLSGAIFALSLIAAVTGQQAPFHSVGGRIVDASGRECLFHGVNVVYKSSPYVPITESFDPVCAVTLCDVIIDASLPPTLHSPHDNTAEDPVICR